jgi:hypothetical protein
MCPSIPNLIPARWNSPASSVTQLVPASAATLGERLSVSILGKNSLDVHVEALEAY